MSNFPSARDVTLPRDEAEARNAIQNVISQQAFARLMGYRLVDAADLAVTLAMPVGMHLLQPYFVHGGAISSLADAASTLAVLTRLWPEAWASTVEQSVQYLRPVSATRGDLLAFAHVRRFGKTISFVEATVTFEGREIATSRSTQVRQPRPKPVPEKTT
ncbi:MAG: PaaI family thioesterase [Polyangiales bacterium]